MSGWRRVWVLPALTLVLSGCRGPSTPEQQQQPTPFVFQALNLRQQDAQGRLQWTVTSPEARYDLSRRLALARQLKGQIFANGKPSYQLHASHGTVLGDGEVIQLEGAVTVERLGQEPVTIQATRMRWYPRQQRIQLDRKAEAFNQDLKLTARQAALLLDRDLLQLRGRPQLQTRQPLQADHGGWTLLLQQIDWSPGSGALRAPGTVLATGASPTDQPRTLHAAGLVGNTLERRLSLQAPLRMEAPDRKAWLQAQGASADFASQRLFSQSPFTARVGPVQIQGGGFELGWGRNQVTIVNGCRLQQPDAALLAQRCLWTWSDDRVLASGGVLLKRQANQQTTRAKQLSGKLGSQGLLVFSSPGSRVLSTLVLPQKKTQQESKPPARLL